MNCKLEKFWNNKFPIKVFWILIMNCKLEKFWNFGAVWLDGEELGMNCKLEKFWNLITLSKSLINSDEL